MKIYIQRYPLACYFVLAYGIAWGGSLLIAAQSGFRPSEIGIPEIGLMFLFMLAGPSAAGLILTALLDGKPGLSQLFARMRNWHFNWRWAVVAMLTVPALSIFILWVLSIVVSPLYKPQITLANIAFGVVAGSLAGFFEEIGWTGFALPRLQARYSPLASGLILGFLWAFWHIMADFWGNNSAFGLFWLPTFIIYWLMPLIAYRTLMIWVHKNSESLPLMQIMHAFYSGTLGVVGPTTTVEEGLLWKALFAAALWAMLTVVIIRYGGELSRTHLKKEQPLAMEYKLTGAD